MKMLMAMALFVSSVAAFGATVKVTSFNFIRTGTSDMGNPLAELCGLVEGAEAHPSFVRILVDSKGRPGIYNTVAGADGKFCLAVITYRGTAEVSLFGQKESVKALIK
jgi:hypothetical protein